MTIVYCTSLFSSLLIVFDSLIIAHIIVFAIVFLLYYCLAIVSFYYCLAIISFYYYLAIIFFISYFILLIVACCRHSIL